MPQLDRGAQPERTAPAGPPRHPFVPYRLPATRRPLVQKPLILARGVPFGDARRGNLQTDALHIDKRMRSGTERQSGCRCQAPNFRPAVLSRDERRQAGALNVGSLG